MIIKTLLVGSSFHPPAILLLQNLPSWAELVLAPEPENPYDAGAIKVSVGIEQIPAARHEELEGLLPGCGMTLSELLAEPFWMLGHVAASGGKPLEKAGLRAGTAEVGEAMAGGRAKARLFFWPDGKPGIEVSYE